MTGHRNPAGQRTVRRHNLSLITTALAAAPGSRAELAQRTGLTKATVSSLVDHLIARAVLIEGEPATRFFVVLDGWLRLFRETVDGQDSTIGVFGPDLRMLFRRGDERDYWDGEGD